MTVLQIFFALCSMNKILEKSREVTLLKFLNLVLKKYGKWFLKMCGNPDSLATLVLTLKVFLADFVGRRASENLKMPWKD